MSGSTFGTFFKISTWGESHGKALGVVIDGCPAGLPLVEEDIQQYLDRRKPGQTNISTPRKEDDLVEILSGTFEGLTTGTPISLIVRNTSQKSRDYSEIASYYRPGHADYTFDRKYGFRDYRGGGRSSGRETIGRVAAGAIAAKVLKELGIHILTYTKSIGPIRINPDAFDQEAIRNTSTCMPDYQADQEANAYLASCMADKDSAGGVIECRIQGVPVGIGDPVFEKLDANLAKAMMSIGAIKAFEIGDGVQVSTANGSSNNDFFLSENGKIGKKTNHAGGNRPARLCQAYSFYFPRAGNRKPERGKYPYPNKRKTRSHHRPPRCRRRRSDDCPYAGGCHDRKYVFPYFLPERFL